jgi:DNA-binding NarL/FixJ family response regulator
MPRAIKVILADDHDSVREGLNILLEFEDDIRVMAEARDGLEAVEKAAEHRPDVVVMDITMPNMDGLAATQEIRRRFPQTQVLIVSAADDDVGVHQALGCGALGYICKHTSLLHVPNAIREIHAGRPFFVMLPSKSMTPAEQELAPVERVNFG